MELIKYDSMCRAIAECHAVDEVKDIRDKAMALEHYAKQAKNTDAERKAADIRLRAERRTGELLKDLARAKNNQYTASASPDDREQQLSEYASALESAGISTQAASRYQQLANVPQHQFEQALADPERKPTTNRILSESRKEQVPTIDPRALRIWGSARDYERHGDFECDPHELLSEMTETMQADMCRLAPLMAHFWENFKGATDQ